MSSLNISGLQEKLLHHKDLRISRMRRNTYFVVEELYNIKDELSGMEFMEIVEHLDKLINRLIKVVED